MVTVRKCRARGCEETVEGDKEYCSMSCAVADEMALPPPPPERPLLPEASEARKQIPIYSGLIAYFPLALAAVARWSQIGGAKHHPGEPLGWYRDKSTDHEDCIGRHLIDVHAVNAAGEYEDAQALAWRALALLQLLEERRLGKPPSRASR